MRVHIEVFSETGWQIDGWDTACSNELFDQDEDFTAFLAEGFHRQSITEAETPVRRRQYQMGRKLSPSLLNRRLNARVSIKRRRREKFPAPFCFSWP